MSDAANEFEAIRVMHAALEPLDDEARTRVLTYIASLLSVDPRIECRREEPAENDAKEKTEEAEVDEATKQAPSFPSFAELFAAADPKSSGEKALVAGYWLQVCEGAESFTAAVAHKELRDLGHKLANITGAIDSMKSQRPMLILQLRKSGTSRQARKLYKLSHEGIKRIKEIVGG